MDTLGAIDSSNDEQFMNSLAFVAGIEQWVTRSWVSAVDLGIRTTWFSDNLGVSVPLSNSENASDRTALQQLLRLLAAVQTYLLLDFGILSRGGVAVGACYHDNNVLFGPALVEAVHLEWAADTPRIVLSVEASQLVDGDSVPLFAAEPLRAKPGCTLLGAAESIDFLRAEIAPAVDAPAQMLRLLRILEAGRDRTSSDRCYKWQWAIDRVNDAMRESYPA
jgi:hypothetical protein